MEGRAELFETLAAAGREVFSAEPLENHVRVHVCDPFGSRVGLFEATRQDSPGFVPFRSSV